MNFWLWLAGRSKLLNLHAKLTFLSCFTDTRPNKETFKQQKHKKYHNIASISLQICSYNKI